MSISREQLVSRISIIWFITCASALTPRGAQALQPLAAFVESSRGGSPDNQEARAQAEQQRAQAQVALGGALPGLTARGTYTRNQATAEINLPLDPNGPPIRAVLTPANQLEALVTLNVPLVDLARFQRIAAARTSARAAEHQARATALQVEADVVQGYYQLVANAALVRASHQALDVARASLTLTQDRQEAGTVSALDVDRARAEVERQVQQLASSELALALSVRALESLSGLAPELDGSTGATVATTLQDDDLQPEPGLETYLPQEPRLPSLAAAHESTRAAEQQARAQRLTLLPSLAGSITERISNAAGFAGNNAAYTASLSLSWALDYTSFANLRSQDAALAVARAREERARRGVLDTVHRAWSQVAANIAKSRSARAQVQASHRAAELALDRYQVGATTQLDLLQAQRDAFTSEVSRIQADAELANARAQLRIAAGQSPFASPNDSDS
ncbi:TolC family protein [Myxococcus sp. K38C18041901]|uniref:TolC family protein n=1 Tax=Myxococcus guangdongensis TaxID=2906760 RepID=UPI0020A82BF7|nr:TolC family protein [Myxococcus guangdongensis]MCP3065587.1 TolC family protein [Myxococcus guangdongensis]